MEYVLPPDAVRFRATGSVLGNGRGQRPGPTQFLTVVATPGNTATTDGIAIPVALADLGLPAGARVRDLWSHVDLGEVRGEFAPVIPFHGAGLYRLSPLPPRR